MHALFSKVIGKSLPNVDAKVGTTHTGGSHIISNNTLTTGSEITIGNKTSNSSNVMPLIALGAVAALVYGAYVYRKEIAEAVGIESPKADR